MKTIQNSLIIFNLTCLFCLLGRVEAQNIGINGTGANAHASALLDVDASPSNDKGLLIHRISLTAINLATPIITPTVSLLVYNIATASTGTNAVTPGFYYWNSTNWVRLSTTNDWALTGNAGTNPAINYLGTSDAQDFVVKTNNTERLRVLSTGNVGIGIAAPTASLHIVATATNTGFQLQDGTQGTGKILKSDNNGMASWAEPAGLANYPYQTIGNLPIGASCPVAGSYSTTTINLPAGIYIYQHYACDYQLGVATNGTGFDIYVNIVGGTGDATATFHKYDNISVVCGHYYTGILRCYTPCTVQRVYKSYLGSSFTVPGANSESTNFVKIL